MLGAPICAPASARRKTGWGVVFLLPCGRIYAEVASSNVVVVSTLFPFGRGTQETGVPDVHLSNTSKAGHRGGGGGVSEQVTFPPTGPEDLRGSVRVAGAPGRETVTGVSGGTGLLRDDPSRLTERRAGSYCGASPATSESGPEQSDRAWPRVCLASASLYTPLPRPQLAFTSLTQII